MTLLENKEYKITSLQDNQLGVDNTYNTVSLKLFSSYFQEYYGNEFLDRSFLIMNESVVLARVLCYQIENVLCMPHDGVKIDFYCEDKNKKKILLFIMSYLQKYALENKCKEIHIQDQLIENKITYTGEYLLNNRYEAKLTFDMRISFEDFKEEKYFTSLRKSYKSFINWGKKNLLIKYVNQENLSYEMFQKFKDFHLKIAGRKTRSDQSWDLQFEMLKNGYGELVLAYYQDSMVAGSLFADFEDISVYCTGVNERDLFCYGLSHYVLFHGICRSYERKNTTNFSLGYFDTVIKDDKLYNIQFFKKGFTQELLPKILWHCRLNDEDENE